MSQSPKKKSGRKLLTTEEASQKMRTLGLRRKPSTLKKWRSSGRDGPEHITMGRSVYYDPADIEAWVEYSLSRRRHTSEFPRRPVSRDTDIFKALGLPPATPDKNDD